MTQTNGDPATTDTVTVACKQPNGLRLNIYKMEEDLEPAPGGHRKVKRAVKLGPEVVLYGTALMPNRRPAYDIVGGYALTPNVPAQFMKEWLLQNADSPLVRNGIVFVNPTGAMARDQAKDQRKLRSGLEPIRIDREGKLTDERAPRNVQVADENLAKPSLEEVD